MKAIYIKLRDKVYKVKQDTMVPNTVSICKEEPFSTVEIDRANRYITQRISISNVFSRGIQSNSELYNELVEYIKEERITEINEIQNFFKIFIDYTVYENGREIDHSSVMKPIKPIDVAVLLGISPENECVYRRVKKLNSNININMNVTFPHGIINGFKRDTKLKINNIAIFQDFSVQPEFHCSTYDVGYGTHSSTINGAKENLKVVFSTEREDINIQEISVPFVPRRITLDITALLGNYIVAYNDNDINKILDENASIDEEPDDITDIPSDPSEPDVDEPTDTESGNPDESEDIDNTPEESKDNEETLD